MWRLRGPSANDEALRRYIQRMNKRVTRLEIRNPAFTKDVFVEFCVKANALGSLNAADVGGGRGWIVDCLRKVQSIEYFEMADVEIDGETLRGMNDWKGLRSLTMRRCYFTESRTLLVTGERATGVTIDGCKNMGGGLNCSASKDMQSIALMGVDLRGFSLDVPIGLRNLSLSFQESRNTDCMANIFRDVNALSYNTLDFRETSVDNHWVHNHLCGLNASVDTLVLSSSRVVLDGALADALSTIRGLSCVHIDGLNGDGEWLKSRLKEKSPSVRSVIY